MRTGKASRATAVLGSSRLNAVGFQGNLTCVQDQWVFGASEAIANGSDLHSTVLVIPGNSGIQGINIFRQNFQIQLEVSLGFSDEEARGQKGNRVTLLDESAAASSDILIRPTNKVRSDAFLNNTNKARELVLTAGAAVADGAIDANDIIHAQIFFINL